MPKLAVIGTSHVACLKLGWDVVAPERPDWTVDFFASTRPHFHLLRLTPDWRFELPEAEHGREEADLVRKWNGGRLGIDLAGYDTVLWCGFGRPLGRVLKVLGDADVEGLVEGGGGERLSRADFDRLCDEIAEDALPASEWLGRETPRLVMMCAPNPDESLDGGGGRHKPWVRLARRPGDKRALTGAFLDRYEAALAAHGVGLLRQPPETLGESGLTLARYGRESRRLDIERAHGASDHVHMNADYGAIVLRALIDGRADVLSRPPHVARSEAPGRDRPARPDAAAPAAPWQARALPPEAAAAASPYAGLEPRAYWRSGVAERAPLDPGDLYRPRFPIGRGTRIATAGSCFAQHVGRALRGAGFDVLDAEPAPPSIAPGAAAANGYGIFSGRYGNLYTARQLAQLLEEAEGRFAPALPVWQRGGRFFDAQRPGVDPDGLAGAAEVLERRAAHLEALRGLFRRADLFVFTFGLTEAWVHRETGTVYPTAPGTIAGSHDPEVFAFRNYDATEVLADFEAFRDGLKAINPGVRFLVTVSPVPLTATASGEHVEVATAYSKATLRAVCGMLTARHDDIDYFPSFEIITSQNARGAYYEPNMRNVSPMGVATAMRAFMAAHDVTESEAGAGDRRRGRTSGGSRRAGARAGARREAGADPCEDALLEAFAR